MTDKAFCRQMMAVRSCDWTIEFSQIYLFQLKWIKFPQSSGRYLQMNMKISSLRNALRLLPPSHLTCFTGFCLRQFPCLSDEVYHIAGHSRGPVYCFHIFYPNHSLLWVALHGFQAVCHFVLINVTDSGVQVVFHLNCCQYLYNEV